MQVRHLLPHNCATKVVDLPRLAMQNIFEYFEYLSTFSACTLPALTMLILLQSEACIETPGHLHRMSEHTGLG